MASGDRQAKPHGLFFQGRGRAEPAGEAGLRLPLELLLILVSLQKPSSRKEAND